MAKEPDKNESELGLAIISLIVTIFIIGLWILTYYQLKDDDDRGVFGDMFGSINSLFSGLALAGIILTILLQRKELKLQREELQETRKEFEIQNATLKLQRFENTFFNLLNLHHQIVDAIDFRYYTNKESGGWVTRGEEREKEAVTITGRDVFRFRYSKLNDDIKGNPGAYENVYIDHYSKAQTDFGHYFRNLYRMIKLVDETDFFYSKEKTTESEIFKIKYRYTSIIRAQLSDYELLWLFYNCLTKNGNEKFKPLIERYSLFKNLPQGLVSDASHILLYNRKAFSPDIA